MSLTIRAHYDGRVIVPEEPLDLPADQQLEVNLRAVPEQPGAGSTDLVKERLARLARATGTIEDARPIPPEALRREHLYEECL